MGKTIKVEIVGNRYVITTGLRSKPVMSAEYENPNAADISARKFIDAFRNRENQVQLVTSMKFKPL